LVLDIRRDAGCGAGGGPLGLEEGGIDRRGIVDRQWANCRSGPQPARAARTALHAWRETKTSSATRRRKRRLQDRIMVWYDRWHRVVLQADGIRKFGFEPLVGGKP